MTSEEMEKIARLLVQLREAMVDTGVAIQVRPHEHYNEPVFLKPDQELTVEYDPALHGIRIEIGPSNSDLVKG